MAYGLPDNPPPDIEFVDSEDDETCPSCGWDKEPVSLDHNAAHNAGILLAVEVAESSPCESMGGAQLVALYIRCPQCRTFFTAEEENIFAGGMS